MGGRFPAFMGYSQDVAARVFNQVGLYRLGVSSHPAPIPPRPDGMTASEWLTIWHLKQAAKARSALLQDIAAWQQSDREVRAAGTLGNRPLIVLSSQNRKLAPEYRDVWTELQTHSAALSLRGKQVTVNQNGGDLIYDAPHTIVAAVRQIISDLQ
jgi:hypothetical protein